MICLDPSLGNSGDRPHVCLTLASPTPQCLAFCPAVDPNQCAKGHLETKLMSQAWRVIAPGRKEATGSLGELLDALLSGSATGLVPLLAVPLKIHR